MTAQAAQPDGPKAGPSGLVLPHTQFSRLADRVIGFFGEISSWLWTVLMLLIVYQVVQRYVFSKGSIKLEEMQWHLYAVGIMLGLAFTEIRERHVRIDVLAEHWPVERRLWIELAGLIFLLLPFAAFMIWYAVPFVITSWRLNEISAAPDGLPYRWALKSFIVTSFVLLVLAGLSRLTRVWAALRQVSRG
ncbi:MAG: TRAP transporter small permease subunit [Alphaproteobacteria bacterium]|nr:TRAP transporter small permease subunit [Alphaproteobacteria bacterium]